MIIIVIILIVIMITMMIIIMIIVILRRGKTPARRGIINHTDTTTNIILLLLIIIIIMSINTATNYKRFAELDAEIHMVVLHVCITCQSFETYFLPRVLGGAKRLVSVPQSGYSAKGGAVGGGCSG